MVFNTSKRIHRYHDVYCTIDRIVKPGLMSVIRPYLLEHGNIWYNQGQFSTWTGT